MTLLCGLNLEIDSELFALHLAHVFFGVACIACHLQARADARLVPANRFVVYC